MHDTPTGDTLQPGATWLRATSRPAPDMLSELKRWNRRLSALRWLLGAWEVPVLPEYVGFNVTTRCNLACPHCPSHGTPAAKQAHNDGRLDMPRPLFARLAEELLPSADLFSLTLTGEPLALPDLEEWLSLARPHGARLHLVTNGTLLTPRRVALLLPLCGVLQLSIDGASPGAFELLRRGARYARFLQNARLASRVWEQWPPTRRARLGLTCVGMAGNLEEWPALVRLAHRLGYGWLHIGTLVPHFDQHRDESPARDPRALERWRAEALAVGRELGVLVEIQPATEEAAGPAVRQSGEGTAAWSPGEATQALPLDNEKLEREVLECLSLLRDQACHPPAPPAGIEAALRDRQRDHRELLLTHAGSLSRLERTGAAVWHCVHLQQRLHVRFDGSVFPCPRTGQESVGSLASESPLGVWNGPALTDWRRRLFGADPPPVCRSCPHLRQVPGAALLANADQAS